MKKIIVAIVIIGFLYSSTSCSPQPANDSSQNVISNSSQEEVEVVEVVEPVATAEPLPTPTFTAEPLPTPTETAPAWQASSPIAQFTDEDIDYLGIQCTGDDADIADCIKEWQEDNILFCVNPSGDDITPTCSALIETNELLPGILTSKDVIYNPRLEGKIPGLCMDYAATYCSIAEYYGIQCRIVRSNHRFCEEVNCDEEDATPGYDQLSYSFFIKPLLDKNELPFTLESINSVAEDNWAHYWAEVLIDGEWEFMDASARDTANRYAQNDVVVVDWEEMDKSDEIVSFLEK
jgi:hypothetical protein